jgi:mannose-6-phosphate isomerase-like protein (cupin superfamily)
MNAINLCAALSAFTVLGETSSTQAQPFSAPEGHQDRALTESRVFSLDRMPSRVMPNGGRSWDILHGTLATGEVIALHVSSQPAGLPPNPPHTIQHSEFIFVQQGTLLFEHGGKSETVGAGGVIFVAPGSTHTARNLGDGAATYLVIAIGGDTK